MNPCCWCDESFYFQSHRDADDGDGDGNGDGDDDGDGDGDGDDDGDGDGDGDDHDNDDETAAASAAVRRTLRALQRGQRTGALDNAALQRVARADACDLGWQSAGIYSSLRRNLREEVENGRACSARGVLWAATCRGQFRLHR